MTTRFTWPRAMVWALGVGVVLLSADRVHPGPAPEAILKLDVLECVFSDGGKPVACGTAGPENGGNVPWEVAASPCAETVDVVVGVVVQSRLEPCVTTPSECDKSENFQDGATFGCTDQVDNDNDGLTDLEDPDCIGIKAWSFSVATDPCFNVQVDGTTVSGTVADLSINGGLRSVVGGSFSKTEVVDPAKNGGQGGVVTSTVLGFTEPIILDQVGDHILLRVRGLLDNSSQAPCGLRFGDPPDGLVGSGDPVRTVMTVSSNSIPPQLINTTVQLVPEGGSEDCNSNEVADMCEVGDGSVPDCDENGVPDSCDIASGAADCDSNGVQDSCEIAAGAGDCDEDGVPDSCDIAGGVADCDENGVPDSCEIAAGAADCDENGVPDSCDIASGVGDCDENGVPDSCEIAAGAADCDENGVPDSCDIASGVGDCDENGVPDSCEIAAGAADCDEDGVPDTCDIASGAGDCDENGVPDSCEIAAGAADCDEDGVPDSCDIASGAAQDCNENGVPDSCDIALGTSDDLKPDGEPDGVPDECAPSDGFIRGDCDADGSACSGVGDAVFLLTWFFSGGNEPGCLAACDVNGDGEVEGVSDAIANLNFCFQGSAAPPPPFPDCGPGTASDEVVGCLQVPAMCQ